MRFVQQQSFGPDTPKRCNRRDLPRASTTVVDLPDANSLLNIAHQYMADGTKDVTLVFGRSTVHPNDEFCRKVGLKLALDKLTKKKFVIVGISTGEIPSDGAGEFTRIVLFDEEEIGIEIVFNPKTKYVRAQIGNITDQGEQHDGCSGSCGGNCQCG